MFNLKNKLEYKKYIKSWQNKNKHNFTNPIRKMDINRIEIGIGTYGDINASILGENGNLIIGNYCSIASGVQFLVSADHYTSTLTTYPFKVKYCEKEKEALSKGDIVVKDDVWIGTNALILSGVTINQGAIIAAGAVVTKDVPPYAIVGGNPAKVIKYRFNHEVISYLLTVNFDNIDKKMIKNNIDMFYKEIKTTEDVKDIIENLTKFN